MGMHQSCRYENFSTTNVEFFEERLTEWCKKALWPGKSMLIFDRNSLRIEKKHEKDVIDEVHVYKVVLSEITLTYICVPGSAKCIMYKIWENKTLSVIYNMPKKWDGTELWLGE